MMSALDPSHIAANFFVGEPMSIPDAEAITAAVNKGERKRKRSETNKRTSRMKWRKDSEQISYSVKLFQALRRIRGSFREQEIYLRSRAIREAADQALAVAARGRTRWSRAILSRSKLKLKTRRPRAEIPSCKRLKMVAVCKGGSSASKEIKKSTILEGKAAFLGRLIPGCTKLSFPLLLEEATDYIAALEMQVRAMSTLSAILSTSNEAPTQESDRSTS